jgi:UDP-glucuronate decarboxylase
MLELAELVLMKTKSTSTLVFKSLPSDDPRQRKPDISKSKELLQWEPKIKLIDGLNDTISYFQNNIV